MKRSLMFWNRVLPPRSRSRLAWGLLTFTFGVLALVALAASSAAQDADGAKGPSLAELEARLGQIAARAGGKVGVSVLHVESGRVAAIGGAALLPLYSVFKLPLAVAVLKAVEAGQLSLEQTLSMAREDVAPGAPSNTTRWQGVPFSMTVRQLLELSLVASDNTSSDKLLALIGGPEALTRRMRELGVSDIDIRTPTKEFGKHREHPNRGSAAALTKLLAALERGLILKRAERDVLWDMMARSTTGRRRLRGALPPGTPAIDKTGTGRDGSGTNDVGVVTLPGGRGHLALAVLITGSKLTPDQQESLIAELGRVAFDAYASTP
jgi:beta-lactamase class A